MALLGNYSSLHKAPLAFRAGRSASGDRANFDKAGLNRNKFTALPKFSAVANGYVHPYAWTMPQTPGGLASYKQLTGAIVETTVYLVSGVNIEAAISGEITTTDADLGLIVSLEAAISGSITTTDALLAAVATLTADGLTAAISATTAELGAIVSMTASLSASGSFTDVADFATSEMTANISSSTELSPESLAYAVWAAIAGDNNTVGTMGEKLNDAGSAANPWTEVIEGSYTATEVLRILLAVAAGKTSIVDNGGGSATVTFRDTQDATNRVVADMTGSERTTLTLDPS